ITLSCSARSRSRRLNGRFRGGRLQSRIKPAGVHPSVKRFLGLGIDVSLPGQATEGGLDVGARAAKPVIQIEVTEGRIEVVAPQQVNHAAAKPDTLRIASRAAQDPRCLGNLIDLFLGFLNGVSSRFLRFGRFAIPALGVGSRNGEGQAGYKTQHGRKLTQLERKPHCPRRMFALGACARPKVSDRIGTLIRRCLARSSCRLTVFLERKTWPQPANFVPPNRAPCLRPPTWQGHPRTISRTPAY